MRIAFLLALALIIAGCGGSGGGRYGDYEYAADEAADEAADAAAEAAYEAKQAVFEEHGADSDGASADASNVNAYDVEDSRNYVCTEDCSGHEAGFEWAQENDVSDSFECGGNSQSFLKGCEAFAEARQEQADSEAQKAAEEVAAEAEVAAEEAEAEADYDYDDLGDY